jgi:sugar transferase (PEP-CTERM system associated)
MIRIFSIYYPIRVLILVVGEAMVVCLSFVMASVLRLGYDSVIVLQYEYGLIKILAITVLALLGMDYFDLYDAHRVPARAEIYFRIFVVLGLLSLALAALSYLFPALRIGKGTLVLGLLILTFAVVGWRSLYGWLVRRPWLRERICIMGNSERADRLAATLRSCPDLGMDVVGWLPDSEMRSLGNNGKDLLERLKSKRVNRLIVALDDRRGKLPVRELLALRFAGVEVEDATQVLERTLGVIEVEGLYPSWFIFSKGFPLNPAFVFARRILSVFVALISLALFLPLIPLIALAIKLTSSGPVLYRQRRVGRGNRLFTCYKFRTMRADSEAASGPTWASKDDPRITPVGRWLRRTRLDEIPQIWNVLVGNMAFVGPRPERPQFMELLNREIPYYDLRHVVRPGITGWAQVCYEYGSSVEQAREKLKYDLYYIKNMSISLDLVIAVRSIKIILLGRGAL